MKQGYVYETSLGLSPQVTKKTFLWKVFSPIQKRPSFERPFKGWLRLVPGLIFFRLKKTI